MGGGLMMPPANLGGGLRMPGHDDHDMHDHHHLHDQFHGANGGYPKLGGIGGLPPAQKKELGGMNADPNQRKQQRMDDEMMGGGGVDMDAYMRGMEE